LLIQDPEKVSFQDFCFLFIWADSLPTEDTLKSPGLEFVIFLHIEGFPLFVPPPLFWDLKFQGYYAITCQKKLIAKNFSIGAQPTKRELLVEETHYKEVE
jgi:hypothetical protein